MGSKKVTLTIDGLDANEKKSSTKIQYVNPNVSDDVMRTFANKCAALSTDTHTATTKTTDEDITNAATPKPKLTLTMPSQLPAKLNLTSLSTETNTMYVLFNEESLPNFVYRIEQPRDFYDSCVAITVYNAEIGATSDPSYYVRIVAMLKSVPSAEGNVTVTIYFDETETTEATTAQVTIPITGNATLTIL